MFYGMLLCGPALKVKFTGLAQNLGHLQASNKDFYPTEHWANLQSLGQTREFSGSAGATCLEGQVVVHGVAHALGLALRLRVCHQTRALHR
jgi:hypothetical protein